MPAREADGDARGDAEEAQHQRHRAGEVLAVAALRPRDEVLERGNAGRGLRRVLVVDEAAAEAEPLLEGDRRRVGALGTARDSQGVVVEGLERPQLVGAGEAGEQVLDVLDAPGPAEERRVDAGLDPAGRALAARA